MQIKREYKIADVEKLFFPVEERPISYYDSSTSKYFCVSKYKALVDAEKGKVLSVVSRDYKVVTNNDAFQIVKPIANAFFGGGGLQDFECFNLHFPKTRASCRIDLTRRDIADFDVDGDKYMAFIRMANSYNRTSRLSVKIGFCRWICLNGCIFGEKSFTFSVDHSDSILRDSKFITDTVEKAMKAIGDLATIKREFHDALVQLQKMPFTNADIRKLFCKVFDLKLTSESIKDLKDKKKCRLVEIDSRLEDLISAYVEEFGETAYAGYNVLTDFASYDTNDKGDSVFTPSNQTRVGEWLKTFSESIAKNTINVAEYLKDYDESQRVLRELRKEQKERNA